MTHGRRWSALFSAIVLATILLVTLQPDPGEELIVGPGWGPFGASDAVRNFLLFVPLGVAVRLAFRETPAHRLLLALFATTLGIEFAQEFIPGRQPSLFDVAFNVLGGGFGLWAARAVTRITEATRHGLLLFLASLAATACFAASVWLLGPSFPRGIYWGQLMPRLGHMSWYRGRVLEASVGSQRVRSWRLDDQRALHASLEAGDTVRVRFVAGPDPGPLGPILVIVDEERHEATMLGVHESELVLRFRRRARDVGLDHPTIRIPDAVHRGDTLEAKAWRHGATACLALGAERRCVASRSPALGWSLVLYPVITHARVGTLLSLIWVAAWMLPVGLFVHRGARSVVAAGVPVTVLLLFSISPGAPLPLVPALGAAAGVYLGFIVSRLLWRHKDKGVMGDT